MFFIATGKIRALRSYVSHRDFSYVISSVAKGNPLYPRGHCVSTKLPPLIYKCNQYSRKKHVLIAAFQNNKLNSGIIG